MAGFPKKITVMCMGEFEDCAYIGGKEKVVTILNEDLANLQYLINHELPPDWRSTKYRLYYISSKWYGTKKRHLISSDEDLLKLCEGKSAPVVYIQHDVLGGPSGLDDVSTSDAQPEQEVYVPSYEHPESSVFGYDPQSTVVTNEGLEAIQRYATLDWFGDSDHGCRGNTAQYVHSAYETAAPGAQSFHPWASWQQPRPITQSYQPGASWQQSEPIAQSYQPGASWQPPEPESEPEPESWSWSPLEPAPHASQWDPWPDTSFSSAQPSYGQETPTEGDWRTSEPDELQGEEEVAYEEELVDTGTDSNVSEDMSDTEHIRFTACEFAAWVRREGGMSRLLTLTDAGEDQDEPEPLPNTNEMNNWLLPMIPLDTTASFIQVDFDPERAVDLDVGAKFKSKNELQIAVGVWSMKSAREVRSKKSDPRRVYYKCAHSARCIFDVRLRSISLVTCTECRWLVGLGCSPVIRSGSSAGEVAPSETSSSTGCGVGNLVRLTSLAADEVLPHFIFFNWSLNHFFRLLRTRPSLCLMSCRWCPRTRASCSFKA